MTQVHPQVDKTKIQNGQEDLNRKIGCAWRTAFCRFRPNFMGVKFFSTWMVHFIIIEMKLKSCLCLGIVLFCTIVLCHNLKYKFYKCVYLVTDVISVMFLKCVLIVLGYHELFLGHKYVIFSSK